MKKTAMCLMGLVVLATCAPVAMAEEWGPSLPKTITLLHETKLYASADESSPSWASLAPQDVETASAEANWYNPFYGEKKWVKIHTSWLGDQWVHIDSHEIGWLVPKDTLLDVTGEMPLYNEPEYGYTGATLASQIVHTKGIFYRHLQLPTWLLDTWLGDKWFTPSNNLVIEGVTQATYETVTLQGEASLFTVPGNQPYVPYAETIAPQTLKAIALYGDFYKVVTGEGKTGWVSPRYSQPAVVEPTNADIALTQPTDIYAYPNLQSLQSRLAPQTVHAKGKVQDDWGNTWLQIPTWMGDAWVLHNDDGILNPNKATGDNGFIHVFPKVISGSDRTATGRIYVERVPQYEGYGGFTFTLQAIDDQGNVLASAAAAVSGVQPNDDVPFTARLDRWEAYPKFSFRVADVQFVRAY